MPHYVYIIESQINGRKYIGSTADFTKRLEYHNRGSNKSTKPHRPYMLIYLEKCSNKTEALKRERQLKAFKGGNALKKLISSWDAGVANRNGL